MALHQWRPLLIGASGSNETDRHSKQEEAALRDYKDRVAARENRRAKAGAACSGGLTSSLQATGSSRRKALGDRTNRLTASHPTPTSGQLEIPALLVNVNSYHFRDQHYRQHHEICCTSPIMAPRYLCSCQLSYTPS